MLIEMLKTIKCDWKVERRPLKPNCFYCGEVCEDNRETVVVYDDVTAEMPVCPQCSKEN